MPPTPDWNKYIDAGAEFVALTRAQARRRAKELVSQGQLAQNQVQTFVDDLVEESRRRTDDMLDLVRVEIQRQVKTLGIATKEDLAKLEARITGKPYKPAAKAKSPKLAAGKLASRKGGTAKSGTNLAAGSGKKSGTKSTKKSGTKKAATKKAAKKSSAPKSGAKKAAKSSATKTGAAKKAAS